MEKTSLFSRIILVLCFVTLIITAIETNQIRLQTRLTNEETLTQKFMYNFPVKLKLGQSYTNKNTEFVIKSKEFSEKLSAPISTTTYTYWGESYTHENSYTPKDNNNTLVYVNTNIKSLNAKKAELDELISAKIIYDKKYEFDCFATKTTADKTNFTTKISLAPLQNAEVYFISELPKELIDSEKPLTLELKIKNRKYDMDLK